MVAAAVVMTMVRGCRLLLGPGCSSVSIPLAGKPHAADMWWIFELFVVCTTVIRVL